MDAGLGDVALVALNKHGIDAEVRRRRRPSLPAGVGD
jgi:hypothetical protein